MFKSLLAERGENAQNDESVIGDRDCLPRRYAVGNGVQAACSKDHSTERTDTDQLSRWMWRTGRQLRHLHNVSDRR